MNCPRCKTALTLTIIKEVSTNIEVDHCTNCEGTWFDRGELDPINKVVEPVFWESRNIPSEDDQLIGLNCPKCTDTPLMLKAEHPRDHHVILDCCPNCEGIWVDKGEIKAIQQENWLTVIGNLFS